MKKMNSMRLKKYQLLLKYSQEIILFFDQKGNIIDFNNVARDVIGYDNQDKQLSICEVFQEAIEYKNNRLMIQSKYLDKGSETVAYRQNKTCFPVHLKVFVEEAGENYIGLCTAVNISEKKRIMRELKYFQNDIEVYKKNRNEFIFNVAHELKTPINGMLGLSEELMKTNLSSEQMETLKVISKCCLDMNNTICDFLDYSKIVNDKLYLEQREFDFRKFIDSIIASYIPRINAKGLNFMINIEDDIPGIVIGDDYRLGQILNNLISNAIKFTDVGQIALDIVETEQTNHDVELFFIVMDTGIGISLEEKEKLFISFSQVDGSITRRFGGTGLGLSISKLLVEVMNGSINVDSEKGKGSTFTFSVRLGLPNNIDEIKDNEQNLNRDDIDGLIKVGEDNKEYNQYESLGFPSIKIKGHKSNRDALEKLILSVEMENWKRAEELAMLIKNSIPENQSELRKMAFRILLLVRKENHDIALTVINELTERLSEEIGWTM